MKNLRFDQSYQFNQRLERSRRHLILKQGIAWILIAIVLVAIGTLIAELIR